MYKIKFHKLNDSLKHYGRKGMKWGKNIFDTLTGNNGNNYKFGFEGNRWAGANPPSHIKVIEPSPQSAKKTIQAKTRRSIARVRDKARQAIENYKTKITSAKESQAKSIASAVNAKRQMNQTSKDLKDLATMRLEQLKYKKKKAEINKPAKRPVEVNVTDKVENGVTLNSVTNGIGRYDMYSDMARTDAKDPDYLAFDRKQTKKAYPSDWKLSAFKEAQNAGKVIKKFGKLTANSAARHQDLHYDKFYDQAQRSAKEIAYQKYLKKHHPEKAKQRVSNKR